MVTSRTVVGVGSVPPDPCGVTDFGRLLGEELRRRGVKVDERWIVNRGMRLGDAGAAAAELLRTARTIPQESVVLWHYSSFAYTLRGISLPGVLFGLLVRHRRVPVVTLLHEPAYNFGRRGWRGAIQALTQQIALPLVLAGSDVVVVTTSRRARALRLVPRPLRRPVHCVPVFSTLGEGRERRPATAGTAPPVVGVLSWGSDGVRPQVLIGALKLLRPTTSPRLLLLGAGGPESRGAEQWLKLGEQAGLGDRIEFTGVIGADELSRRLGSCDLIVFVNGEGPSSRKTTLAAALAHGLPVISVDGRERWRELVDARAVELCAPRPAALSAVMASLLADPRQRRELGSRAQAFYDAHMTLAKAADALEAIVLGAAAEAPTPSL